MVVESAEKSPVEKASERRDSNVSGGVFRITEWAARRVDAKRKRRGLGEVKPRKKNPIKQIFANSICLSTASVLVAPLERSRILLQTAPLSNFRQDLPVNTRGMLPYIAQSQGY